MINEKSKKTRKQDVIFILIAVLLATLILGYGLYLFVIQENPGMQIIFFMLGGFFAVGLLTIKLRNKWLKYLVFVGHVTLLTIYAWTSSVDLEPIVAILFYWLIIIYIPFEMIKQGKTENYFETKFLGELKAAFINPSYIVEREDSFKINEHPYIKGEYEKGYVGDRIIVTYKGIDFNLCEYHIQGKKDVWHGSIIEVKSIDLDDSLIRSADIKNTSNVFLKKLRKSYGDIIWVVKDKKLSLYVNEFTPIFDTRLRQINNPVNYIRIILDLIIDTLDLCELSND